jgi:protein BCP1
MFPRPRPTPTPSNLKKRAAAPDESPPSEGEMEIEEIDFSSNLPEQQLSVEFEFYDPDPSQFLSLKSLLNGYLDGLSFGSSELCDLVIEQVEVGTMIGVAEEGEEEENNDKNKHKIKNRDVLGFATVIEIGRLGKSKVGNEILGFILEKSAKFNDKHKKLEEILGGKFKTGLLLNERIVNLSPQLIPILHGQILEDLKWAGNEGMGEYQFDYIVCLTK